MPCNMDASSTVGMLYNCEVDGTVPRVCPDEMAAVGSWPLLDVVDELRHS